MEPTPNQRDVCAPRSNAGRKWRCGFEPMGMACSAGPTDNGQCCQTAARAACRAAGTDGCESQCSGASTCEIARLRSESLQVSGDDLRTCIPIKSAWFSRQSIGLNVAILAGGILLFCMALPFRETLFVPGSLSESHSQILGNRLGSDRCSQCHPSSHAGGLAGSSLTQEDLCLNCHAGHMPDAAMLNPHDLNASMLESLRSQWLTTTSAEQLNPIADRSSTPFHGSQDMHGSGDSLAQRLGWSKSGLGEMRCATCHVEHRGPHHDLKSITDARCQSCHRQQFAGFGDGHPEFDGFPYRRERRLAFDHAAHANRYFAQKSQVFDCATCHVDTSKTGSVGVVFRTLGFEQACASCHAGSIRATQSDGWLVLQLPSIEAADAQQSTLGLGDWPSTAQFGYDGLVTSSMAWLLYGDPEQRAALERLRGDRQLSGLNLQSESDLAAAQTLARGVRKLVRSIAADGHLAITERARRAAESILGREVGEEERKLIESLSAGMPPDLFRQIELRWFGGDSKLAETQPPQRGSMRLAVAQQLRNDGSTAEQAAELELQLAISAATGEFADAQLIDSLFADEPTTANLDKGHEVRLAENSLLGGDEALPPLRKLSGLRNVAGGGWYLDEDILAVRYMPTGHADPLITAWTQYALWLDGELRAQGKQDATPESIRPHLSRLPPGGCVECHLLPGRPTFQADLQTLWRSVHQPLDVRPFTKFDHGPHLSLPLVNDCRYCHVIDGLIDQHGEVGSTASVGTSGTVFGGGAAVHEHLQSEFRAMEQAQCTACHRPGGADNGCTQCHNYHVGTPGFEWSRTQR